MVDRSCRAPSLRATLARILSLLREPRAGPAVAAAPRRAMTDAGGERGAATGCWRG